MDVLKYSYVWIVRWTVKNDLLDEKVFRSENEALKYVESEIKNNDEIVNKSLEPTNCFGDGNHRIWGVYRSTYELEKIKFYDI